MKYDKDCVAVTLGEMREDLIKKGGFKEKLCYI